MSHNIRQKRRECNQATVRQLGWSAHDLLAMVVLHQHTGSHPNSNTQTHREPHSHTLQNTSHETHKHTQPHSRRCRRGVAGARAPCSGRSASPCTAGRCLRRGKHVHRTDASGVKPHPCPHGEQVVGHPGRPPPHTLSAVPSFHYSLLGYASHDDRGRGFKSKLTIYTVPLPPQFHPICPPNPLRCDYYTG